MLFSVDDNSWPWNVQALEADTPGFETNSDTQEHCDFDRHIRPWSLNILKCKMGKTKVPNL